MKLLFRVFVVGVTMRLLLLEVFKVRQGRMKPRHCLCMELRDTEGLL